ncbi:MAG: hypothetical protein HYZ45_12010 [Burkholderiales bacterium]|nr:hypothetical protein [Burkholderiales bacterium]
MKKRLPLLISFILFLALCASGAYWGIQLFKPKQRDVTVTLPAPQAEIPLDSAAMIFGGKATTQVASNFQLKGVLAPHDPLHGIAIIAADGQPSKSVPVGRELSPGVQVKEVHKLYVLLDENGITKRVDMPETKGLANGNSVGLPPPPVAMPAVPNNGVPSAPMPPPPPNNSLQNATGMNVPTMPAPLSPMVGGPQNPGAPEATPKPAMPSEPNGPAVSK